MEKPMTTDVNEARRLWEMSAMGYPEGEHSISSDARFENFHSGKISRFLTFNVIVMTRCLYYKPHRKLPTTDPSCSTYHCLESDWKDTAHLSLYEWSKNYLRLL